MLQLNPHLAILQKLEQPWVRALLRQQYPHLSLLSIGTFMVSHQDRNNPTALHPVASAMHSVAISETLGCAGIV